MYTIPPTYGKILKTNNNNRGFVSKSLLIRIKHLLLSSTCPGGYIIIISINLRAIATSVVQPFDLERNLSLSLLLVF
jgi:hypothetical protein